MRIGDSHVHQSLSQSICHYPTGPIFAIYTSEEISWITLWQHFRHFLWLIQRGEGEIKREIGSLSLYVCHSCFIYVERRQNRSYRSFKVDITAGKKYCIGKIRERLTFEPVRNFSLHYAAWFMLSLCQLFRHTNLVVTIKLLPLIDLTRKCVKGDVKTVGIQKTNVKFQDTLARRK